MVCTEDCGYCFISLLGEISEDKAKTKDLREGTFFIRGVGVDRGF